MLHYAIPVHLVNEYGGWKIANWSSSIAATPVPCLKITVIS